VRHPFFRSSRPLVFAHRGGSALAPENTLAAFDNGLAAGADGLELDVHLSRDGIVVVHHDRTLDRTTDLRGPIARCSAEDLSRANAGYRFRSGDTGTFPFRDRALGVPTLIDVLYRYRDVPIIVEVKVDTAAMAGAVVGVIRAAGALDRVCLGSFGRTVLRAVRSLEPAVATSAAREEVRWALYRSWCRWPVARPSYDGYQVPEWAGRTHVVSPRFIADAHRHGLAVQVWTVDDEVTARRLLAWGVDALITDRPDVVVPVAKAELRSLK
jgi:glycerophosphoryl diester phosphodiesterase